MLILIKQEMIQSDDITYYQTKYHIIKHHNDYKFFACFYFFLCIKCNVFFNVSARRVNFSQIFFEITEHIKHDHGEYKY